MFAVSSDSLSKNLQRSIAAWLMSAIIPSIRIFSAVILSSHCLAHSMPAVAILLMVVRKGPKCKQNRANGFEKEQNRCFAALMTVPAGLGLFLMAVASHD